MPDTHNSLTGNLTGRELERRVANVINSHTLDALIIRQQVKVYAAMTAENGYSDAERDVAYELIATALVINGCADTHHDVDRAITKLLNFTRQSGM